MSATGSRPKTATAKATPEAKLSPDEMVAKMDKLLPKWRQYNEDRKAKVPREKRRGVKEYQQFERLYAALRGKGLKLKDARKKK